ncbi:MAG: hypothetical protein HND52_20625 [Ignavibacteriae bacterium]|nr:hypothetical protein [Ignavibacteriota bacterium]NOH00377.1 hypothetical protein [Ignavibacteriota bacterium]
MRIGLLQLSDIHFKARENYVENRASLVIDAIHPLLNEVEKLFIIYSGDIAFSGKANEYKVAKKFHDKLDNSLVNKGIDYATLLIPGNHDCNLEYESEKRKKIIDDILKNNDFKPSIIQECCKVQNDFFHFRNNLKTVSKKHIYNNQLLTIDEFNIKKNKIVFLMYNSSWLSELHEVPGKLFYPINFFKKEIFDIKADMIISVIHHPFNWYAPEVKRSLQNRMEKISDIIFSGHEHINSKSVITDLDQNFTEYIEGAVFQSNDKKSGFNFVLIDLDSMKQKIHFFNWTKDLYINNDSSAKWIELQRNKSYPRKQYQINDNFSEILSDAGATFTHPYFSNLTLKDFFVYPYLMKMKVDSDKDVKISKKYLSSKTLTEIRDSKNLIMLSGAEKIGKTTLCKFLYKEWYEKDLIPLFIEGNDIKNANFDDFEKLVKDSFCNQYFEDSLEYFVQENSAKKILIIDDFDKSKPNKKYKAVLLHNILKKYDNIVITGNQFFILEEYIDEDSNLQSLMSEFEHFKILEFGNELRSELVNKWYGFGTNEYLDEAEQIIKHDEAIGVINTVIGSNLIPSLPFFLLTILQTIESKATNLKASSYGFYYEFLITKSFKNVKIPNDEIDAFYNYISELANYLFEQKIYRISRENFEVFHKWYCKEYSLTTEFGTLIKKLEDSKIIELYGQNYRLKYKYVFYYFEARYIATNITNKKIKDRVEQLAGELHREEYANILMFLTHLSKDPFIISTIVARTTEIFMKLDIIKFEEDISKINDLLDEIPEMVLKRKDYNNVRKERLKKLDEIEKELNEENKDDEPFDNEDIKEEIDVITELNLAFKSIEILGQILKNHFGSIKGQQKKEIGEEAYFVGLRAINSFFDILSNNLDTIVGEIEKIISKKSITDIEEKKVHARKSLFGFCTLLAFIFIKRISESIGTLNLSETFNEILKDHPYNSVHLIDISIKLDHFHKVPIDDLKNLKDIFKKNYLSTTIIRRLVIDHLYMFPVEYQDRQKICSLLNIPIEDQILIIEKSEEKKSKK